MIGHKKRAFITNETGNLFTVLVNRPTNLKFHAEVFSHTRMTLSSRTSLPPPSWIKLPNHDTLLTEFDSLTSKLRGLGVEVLDINEACSGKSIDSMFVRDMAKIVGDVIYVTRSGLAHRSSEADYIMKWFRCNYSSPMKLMIGFVEASDILIMNDGSFSVACGGRSQKKAIEFWSHETRCIVQYVDKFGPSIPQHLLGGNRIVGTRLFTRSDTENFKWSGEIIHLKPSKEVNEKLSMNWITLSPNSVLMPDDCPETESILEDNGIVVYKSKMNEIRKLGGGFACLTLPICREPMGKE